MRVAVVTESFLPHVNGVSNSVLRVLEHLSSGGHQAMVFAPESDGLPREYADFPVKGVPAIPIHNILSTGIPLALPSKKLAYKLEGFAPDILHLASPFILGQYGAKVARKLSIPSLSIYQTDLAGFADHYGLNVAHQTLRKMVARIHSKTDRTLAPSRAAIADLQEMGVENVHLWRRGVNAELFHPAKRNKNLHSLWSAYGERLVVGYVGRLANEKRIHDLKFLDRDPSIQLVIVGDGPAREKLRNELPHAHFLGFQSGENLAEIYASLDLFIHPGPNETFCQAVQEALASGVPAIVPKTGGPADLVTHGQTGYVINTHRPDDLEAAVLHFKLRNDRLIMRRTARESVESRTWRSINNQLIGHYEELITINAQRGVVA